MDNYPSNQVETNRRIEDGLLRLNDKLDIVISQISDLRTDIVRVESSSESHSKEISSLERRQEKFEAETSRRLENLEKDSSLQKQNTGILTARLGPVFLVGVLIVSVLVSRAIQVFWPPSVPHSVSSTYTPTTKR